MSLVGIPGSKSRGFAVLCLVMAACGGPAAEDSADPASVPLPYASYRSFCDLAESFETTDAGLLASLTSQAIHHELAAVEWRHLVGLLWLSAVYGDVDVPTGIKLSVLSDAHMGAYQLEMAPVGLGAEEWTETLKEAGRSFRDGLEALCGVELSWGAICRRNLASGRK